MVIFAAVATMPGAIAAQGSGNYPWRSLTSGVGADCTHPSKSECEYDVQGIGGWRSYSLFYRSGSNGAAGAAAQQP
jgi:hypothetical protein